MKITTTTADVLDQDIVAALALGIAQVSPPVATQTALRARILARAGTTLPAAGDAHLTVHAGAEGWVKIFPLVQMRTLFESQDGRGVLFRMEAGGRLPPHEHNTDEECVILEGELSIGNLTVRAGDFHLARKGIPHAELNSKTGALFYIRTGANFVFKASRP